MNKLILLGTLFALSACASGEVRETLGLTRDAPDEFKVVSRPPLSVPPDFSLRPPDPGAPPREAVNPEEEASRVFLRDSDDAGSSGASELIESNVDTAVTPVLTGSVPTSAESLLLGKLGTEKADPEIRDKLYVDEKELDRDVVEDENATVIDKLLGYGAVEPVIDPFAEAERIRENVDEDKPINEGEVPVIDKSGESTLDKIF